MKMRRGRKATYRELESELNTESKTESDWNLNKVGGYMEWKSWFRPISLKQQTKSVWAEILSASSLRLNLRPDTISDFSEAISYGSEGLKSDVSWIGVRSGVGLKSEKKSESETKIENHEPAQFIWNSKRSPFELRFRL